MNLKKVLGTLLVATSLVAVTGCGSKSEDADKEIDTSTEEKLDITIAGINLGDSKSIDGWNNAVIKKLEEKFNVTLTMANYTNETLNLDLSGGKTADIIQINDNHLSSVLQGKHAVDLEKYKDTLATNVFSETMEFRNDVLKKFKSNDENKTYFVTPRVTSKDAELNYGTNLHYGYAVRWDLYKEIGAPEINNDDDYIAALEKMKKLYPETEDGLPVYAMSPYNDVTLHSYFFKGAIAEGYTNLENGVYVSNVETNEIIPDFYDVNNPDIETPFWSGVKFYNKLYNKGLLDPDAFITKGEDLTEKYTKGQYLGGSVNWYYGGYNQEQQTQDPETLKQFVMLPSKLGWAKESNPAGHFGKYFFVSSHSPNQDRAVMILDYIQSEEFSRDVSSGVEGSTWEIDDQGKPKLMQSVIDLKTSGSGTDEWKQLGVNSSLTSAAGQDDYNVTKDGGLVNLWVAEDMLGDSMTFAERDLAKTLGVAVPSDLLKQRVEAGTSVDLHKAMSVIQVGLDITPKDIVRIDSNSVEITSKAVPNLVQAKTDEEFEAIKADLMKELEAADVQKSIDWWTNAWNTSKTEIEKLQK